MTFAHPFLAAAAVACVAIPIIIHILMRRRRRPVMWAAMRFLLEAYRQNRRRMRLEQLLLLAARCLLIALAGLAIARPLMGKAGVFGGRGTVTLYLLVDNGLASAAMDEGGHAALERHKARASGLLDQLDAAAGDRAALVALGGPAQALVVPPSSSAAGVRDQIAALTPTDSPTDIAGGFAIVRSALEGEARAAPGGRVVVAVLSDFLTGSADTEKKLAELSGADQSARTLVVMASPPAPKGSPNVAIIAAEPVSPVIVAPKREAGEAARPEPVRVELRRVGPAVGEAAATTVRLFVQGDPQSKAAPTPVGQTVVNWAPGQPEATAFASVDVAGAARNGASGSVVLTATIDNDAVAGDNTYRRPIEVRQSLRVGIVAPRRSGAARPGLQQFDPADWFRLALSPADPAAAHAEPDFDVVDIEPSALDAGRLAGLDAAIVLRPDLLPDGSWKRLRAFADSGGLIIVCPPPQATVHLWADGMVRDLGLPWTVAREAKSLGDGGVGLAAEPGAAVGRDLLALLQPEMADLVKPVRVFKVLPVEAAAGAPGAMLKLTDGTPFLIAAHPAAHEGTEGQSRGLVVVLASAMASDWTDLPAKPLMVALAHEVVKQGVGEARAGRMELAGMTPEVPGHGVELRALGETQPAMVKAVGGRTDQPLRRAGLWRSVDETGATRGLLAVNADPSGSRMDPQPESAIAAWLGKAAGVEVQWLEDSGPRAAEAGNGGAGAIRSLVSQGDDSGRLVLPLLVAALVLALLELGMARWFSHAVIRGGAGSAAGAGGAA
jgi:hypothetical protein